MKISQRIRPTHFLFVLIVVLLLTAGCSVIQDSLEVPPTLAPPPTGTAVSAASPTMETAEPGTTPAATITLPTTPTAEETITPTVEVTLNAPPVVAPQVTIASSQPTLNQDLLFIASGSLRLKSATTGGITTLLEAENTDGVTAFSVTADGERVVAARMVNAENRTFELIRVDVQNVRTWKLADAPHLLHFAVSPDGRYALYVAGGRPFAPSEAVAGIEEAFPNSPVQAGTVYLADMETQQSREVGQCVDIPKGADWDASFLVPCQGVYWTNDSQNMLWADVFGIWIRHLNASQPTLTFANSEDVTDPPGVYYRPATFAKNGRHLLTQRIYFEGFDYEVLDLVTHDIIDLPGSQFGIGTGYVNVDWMQDDRLLKLRQQDDSGKTAPALELWRIQDDNSIALEETNQLTDLPPHQNIRFVEHFQNGRFGFLLESDDPTESGLYIMESSTVQPERINGLPYNQVTVIWQPNGSGAIVEQRDAIGNFLYTPADGNVYYEFQPAFGPNPHAFFWRP
ncbi:MAG: hypothetical protein WAM60_14220 [Candidatus Promineifilaceae bacterium]